MVCGILPTPGRLTGSKRLRLPRVEDCRLRYRARMWEACGDARFQSGQRRGRIAERGLPPGPVGSGDDRFELVDYRSDPRKTTWAKTQDETLCRSLLGVPFLNRSPRPWAYSQQTVKTRPWNSLVELPCLNLPLLVPPPSAHPPAKAPPWPRHLPGPAPLNSSGSRVAESSYGSWTGPEQYLPSHRPVRIRLPRWKVLRLCGNTLPPLTSRTRPALTPKPPVSGRTASP